MTECHICRAHISSVDPQFTASSYQSSPGPSSSVSVPAVSRPFKIQQDFRLEEQKLASTTAPLNPPALVPAAEIAPVAMEEVEEIDNNNADWADEVQPPLEVQQYPGVNVQTVTRPDEPSFKIPIGMEYTDLPVRVSIK